MIRLPPSIRRVVSRSWGPAAALTILAYAAWAALRPAQPVRAVAASVLLVAFWSAAAGASLRAARQLRPAPARFAWNLLGIGLALWALAEAIKAGALIAIGRALSVPSLADLLRLAGSFAAVAAFASYPASPPERFGNIRRLLDIGILALSVLALSWMVFIRPLSQVQVAPPIQILWAATPPAFDLVLAGLLSRLALLVTQRRQGSVFQLLLLATIGMALTELVAGYLQMQGELRPGSLVDAGRMMAGLLFVVGSVRLGGAESQKRPERRPRGEWLAARLEPLLAVAFTYAVVGYTALDWWFTKTVDRVGIACGGLLILMLVARQAAIAGQAEMRQFEAVVNATTDLAFICQADGRFRLVNPALRRAFGITDIPGPDFRLADLLAPEAPIARLLWDGMAEGWSGEVQFRRRDGALFPVSLSLIPVKDERRPQPLIVGTAHDLTGVKAREAELNAALAAVASARSQLQGLNLQLEDKVQARTQELAQTVADLARLNEDLKALDRLKSEFVALVSHELRAPLTNIRTGIELILEGYPSFEGSARESLGLVQAEVIRLALFVETILDLSALEAGRFPIHAAPLDIGEAAAAVCSRFPESASGRLVIDTPAGLPEVMADERALTSVFFHLLDNARKYAPEGEIRVEARAEGLRVFVSVSDRGPGIPPEERERVFEMFHRLDPSDSREVYGHGLGLHLAQQLLQAMGGGIRAEEAAGGGARMTLWLPQAT
jgi:PAS domain S-box-containing protein